MTERKPAGVSWQTWIDRQIAKGEAEGAFTDLPGKGKPLDLDGRRDEDWWLRAKLKREKVEYLPPALRVAREREQALADAMAASTEDEVVEILEAINARIRYVNSHVIEGPPSTSVVVDIEEVLVAWRRVERPEPPSPPTAPVVDPPPRRWWRRQRVRGGSPT